KGCSELSNEGTDSTACRPPAPQGLSITLRVPHPYQNAMPAPDAPTSDHLHAHLDGDARHGHYIESRSQKALAFALLCTLTFAVIEVVTGFISNSLALISDAGHMVTDAAALGLALLAQLIAKRPPSSRHSFGFVRAE